MRRKDWYPKVDAELIGWSKAFEAKLSEIAGALSIPPEDVAEIRATGAALRADIQANNSAQRAAQSARAKKDATLALAEKAYRALARRMKAAPGYIASMGEGAGIEGDEQSVDMSTYAPKLSAHITGGHIELRFVKGPAVDGVNIYSRMAGPSAWTRLAYDSQSPYIDNRPLSTPGQPETREYAAIGVRADAEVGQMSDIVVVTVGG